MASNNDIQSEMSTKITVDAQQAGEQVKNLTNKFKDLTASWKAEEAVAKANGDSIGASKARYEGLTQTLEVQKEKVETLKRERQALKSEMESSSTVTKEQTDDLKNLDRQLATAAEKVMSLSNQQRRAKNSFDYAKSGLRDLKNEYYNNNRAIDSNVEKLKAEGQTAEAQKAKLTGLKISLENLNKQQEAAKKLADEAAKSEGSNSNLYKRRITDYNEISAAIAKTKRETDQLDASLIKSSNVSVSGLTRVRDRFLGIYQSEVKATAQAKTMSDVFRGSFIGTFASNVAQNAIMSLTSKMHDLIAAGKQFNVEQDTMKTVWHSLTTQAPRDGQKLLNFINSLSQHSIYSAETINRMAQSFYHVDSSVKHTKEWTNDFVRLGSTMHMTNDQLAEAGEQFAKIVAGGKASQEDMNVMINRFPMFGEALQKATGKSMKQLQQLSQQGKLTANDFVKAMDYLGKKYKGGQQEAMTSYMGMSMYLKSRFSLLAGDVEKSSFKMSKSAKDALVQVTSDKSMQIYANAISKAIAGFTSVLSKSIVFISKHKTAVKLLAGALAGLFIYTRLARGITSFYMTLSKGIAVYKGVSTATEMATLRQKAFNLALKTNAIVLVVSAIAALVAALVSLYRHNAKFRSFVNGIGRSLKNMAKGFVNAGRNILKSAGNLHKNLSKRWSNYWKQRQREQLQANKRQQQLNRQSEKNLANSLTNMRKSWNSHWKSFEKAAQNGGNNVTRWYQRMERDSGKTIQEMARNHPRTFNDMYKTIQDRTRTWHDITNGHWTRLGSDIANEAKDMSATSRSILGDMYDKLNNITGGRLGDILNAWKKHFSNVISTITSSQSPVHQAFMGVLREIAEPFSTIIKGITKGINWIADKIGGSHISEDFSLSGFANGTPGGGLLHDQIALLNDGKGEHYQEMIHKASTGKTFMLPAKRNIILPLEKGDEVLDGENSHRLAKAIGMPIPHANGAIGNFFSGIFDKTKDALEDATDWVDKALKNVVEFGTELFHHFVEGMSGAKDNGREFSQMMHNNLPGYFARIGEAWLKKQLELLDADSQGVVSRDKFERIAKHAATLMHQSLSEHDIDRLYHQAQTESGVNAGQNGGYDDHDGTGLPIGLFQFKLGTWGAAIRHLPANHHNIHSALDQIMAVLADTTWRSDIEQLGEKRGWSPHGYAYGGLVSQHGLYEVAENNNPEMIIPLDISKRGRAYSLLAQVMSQFKSEDVSNNDVNTEDVQVKALNRKFDALLSQNQQLIGLIDKLIGVTDSANNPTARYKRTQRDINLAQSQSFI